MASYIARRGAMGHHTPKTNWLKIKIFFTRDIMAFQRYIVVNFQQHSATTNAGWNLLLMFFHAYFFLILKCWSSTLHNWIHFFILPPLSLYCGLYCVCSQSPLSQDLQVSNLSGSWLGKPSIPLPSCIKPRQPTIYKPCFIS